MATKPRRIDTHAHFLPDFYREELQKNGHSNPDGMPFVPVSHQIHDTSTCSGLTYGNSSGLKKPTLK